MPLTRLFNTCALSAGACNAEVFFTNIKNNKKRVTYKKGRVPSLAYSLKTLYVLHNKAPLGMPAPAPTQGLGVDTRGLSTLDRLKSPISAATLIFLVG